MALALAVTLSSCGLCALYLSPKHAYTHHAHINHLALLPLIRETQLYQGIIQYEYLLQH